MLVFFGERKRRRILLVESCQFISRPRKTRGVHPASGYVRRTQQSIPGTRSRSSCVSCSSRCSEQTARLLQGTLVNGGKLSELAVAPMAVIAKIPAKKPFVQSLRGRDEFCIGK